jgi:hypothetical protein
LADSTTILADKIACAELIQAWGVARDQGKWKDLRATFTPDGHISVSWFRGPFEQFVERCRAAFDAGHTWSRHHLFPPTITLNGDRATAETSVVIRVRQKFNGIDVDLTSCSRFLDRLERHSGGWLIAERAAIYERDRLDPVEPSAAFDDLFAAANTAQYPEQYRYMAFRLAHAEGWLIAERAAIYERDRLDPVEPSPAFDELFKAANTAQYPEQYRYMAFRLAHAEGRSLASVIYRDGGPETADLYARYSSWLAGQAA